MQGDYVPPGIEGWLWLAIDIPICRDFLTFEENKFGHELMRTEAIKYVAAEFHFSLERAKQIIDTIKGEKVESQNSIKLLILEH